MGFLPEDNMNIDAKTTIHEKLYFVTPANGEDADEGLADLALCFWRRVDKGHSYPHPDPSPVTWFVDGSKINKVKEIYKKALITEFYTVEGMVLDGRIVANRLVLTEKLRKTLGLPEDPELGTEDKLRGQQCFWTLTILEGKK